MLLKDTKKVFSLGEKINSRRFFQRLVAIPQYVFRKFVELFHSFFINAATNTIYP